MRAGLIAWAVAGAILLLPATAGAGPKEDLLAADKAFSDLSVAKGRNAAFLFYLAEDGRLFGVGIRPVGQQRKLGLRLGVGQVMQMQAVRQLNG